MTALLRILRAITSAVLVAGIGAVSAAVVVTTMQGEGVAALRRFGFELGAAWILSAAAALVLMPPRAAFARARGDAPPSAALRTLVIALGLAAALQVPALLAWLGDNRARLGPLFTGRPDPIGLDYLPAVVLGLVPAIGLLTLVTFVLTSLLALVVPPAPARRALASCLSLQAGLIAGSSLLERGMYTLASRAVPMMEAPDAATAADWIAQYHRSATAVAIWAFVTFCGYVLATAWARSRSAGVESVAQLPVAAGRPLAASSAVAAPASAAFDASSYAVRPRMTMFEALITRKISSYEIGTIPPTTRARFSFSWSTGALRRDPNGPVLLQVAPARPPGLFASGSYEVRDEAGAAVATLRPKGSDWEILAASGALVAEVQRSTAGRGLVVYHAVAGDGPACTFAWAMAGVSVMSAELAVEFGAASRLDRGVALVLAVILEQQARLVSERGGRAILL